MARGRHRKLRGRKLKKQRRIVIVSVLALTLLLSTGYAAFSTNISLSAKGNIKEKPTPTAAETLTELQEDTTSNLIIDDYGNIRYSGKDVNNYVCMEEEVTCSDENLYRIIGVFKDIKTTENDVEGETRIKLIKATSNGYDYWNTTSNNNWTEASLKSTLNSTSFAQYSNSYVSNAVWSIGGSSGSKTSKNMYNNERGTTGGGASKSTTTWKGKVALMYPSDYGYASSSCYSSKALGDYNDSICTGSNWLFSNQSNGTQANEWLLTPDWSYMNVAFCVTSEGLVSSGNYSAVSRYSFAVRPTVYLKSNVAIKQDSERNGSEEHPYLLELIEESE